jgi:hypothetical protein
MNNIEFVDWNIETIYGVEFGFELLDDESKKTMGARWGISFDFGIFRITVVKWIVG